MEVSPLNSHPYIGCCLQFSLSQSVLGIGAGGRLKQTSCWCCLVILLQQTLAPRLWNWRPNIGSGDRWKQNFLLKVMFSPCHKLLSLKHMKNVGNTERKATNLISNIDLEYTLYFPLPCLLRLWYLKVGLNISPSVYNVSTHFFFLIHFSPWDRWLKLGNACLLWPSLERICFHILCSSENNLFWVFPFALLINRS